MQFYAPYFAHDRANIFAQSVISKKGEHFASVKNATVLFPTCTELLRRKYYLVTINQSRYAEPLPQPVCPGH